MEYLNFYIGGLATGLLIGLLILSECKKKVMK